MSLKKSVSLCCQGILTHKVNEQGVASLVGEIGDTCVGFFFKNLLGKNYCQWPYLKAI